MSYQHFNKQESSRKLSQSLSLSLNDSEMLISNVWFNHLAPLSFVWMKITDKQIKAVQNWDTNKHFKEN